MAQPLPEVKVLKPRGRFVLWVLDHQLLVRLVSLAVCLLALLIFLPQYIWTSFWSGLQAHKILASMLLVFCLMAISLIWSTGSQIDAWVFLIFNVRGWHPLWLDRIMLGFTQIGSGLFALGLALLLFLASNRLLSYEFMLGVLSLLLVVELVKFLVHRSRPFIRLSQARIVGFRAIGQSFPSGHTSQAFFMATLLSLRLQLGVWVTIALYAIAALVGITRMYVGAHYPRDVIAGAMLGTIWGALVTLVDPYWIGLGS